jgi:AcrR family transcriptional regulator
MTTRQTDLQARRRGHRRNAGRCILDAAHPLLQRKPWAEPSLDDITSAAEVARTPFYRHVDDRQNSLVAMLSHVGRELDHLADNWLADTDDPVVELRRSLADK